MKTEMQEKFVEHFIATGNATKAAMLAGYSEKTAHVKGCPLKKRFAADILEMTQQMMVDATPRAMHILRELSENATSESVKLAAVKDILDRAGLKPVDRVETTNIEQTSTSELRRELESLMSEEIPEPIGTLN